MISISQFSLMSFIGTIAGSIGITAWEIRKLKKINGSKLKITKDNPSDGWFVKKIPRKVVSNPCDWLRCYISGKDTIINMNEITFVRTEAKSSIMHVHVSKSSSNLREIYKTDAFISLFAENPYVFRLDESEY